MLKCKLCGESLYQNLNFTMLFQSNIRWHQKCVLKLNFNKEEIVIPIDYNSIIYDFVLERIFTNPDEEYLAYIYLGRLIYKYLEKACRSIIIYLDQEMCRFMENDNPYLIFTLSREPIIMISFWEVNLDIFNKL